MKYFSLVFILALPISAFSQMFSPVYQTIRHEAQSTAPNGCVSVRFIVDFMNNGLPASSTSAVVTLNKNSTTTLSANVPIGQSLNIIAKRVIISCTNGSYTYTLTNSAQDDYVYLVFNQCNGVTSNYIHLNETSSSRSPLFTFGMTGVVGQ